MSRDKPFSASCVNTHFHGRKRTAPPSAASVNSKLSSSPRSLPTHRFLLAFYRPIRLCQNLISSPAPSFLSMVPSGARGRSKTARIRLGNLSREYPYQKRGEPGSTSFSLRTTVTPSKEVSHIHSFLRYLHGDLPKCSHLFITPMRPFILGFFPNLRMIPSLQTYASKLSLWDRVPSTRAMKTGLDSLRVLLGMSLFSPFISCFQFHFTLPEKLRLLSVHRKSVGL